jgi:flagella basal body P-ring formation protein FlgA
VLTIDAVDAFARFREVRPDPSAWLGKPVRFTLIRETGAPLLIVATLRVIATHAVTRTAIERGHVVDAESITSVREEIKGTPIRPMPAFDEVAGARALRPIPQGATILPGLVALKRAVEPGDRVTVVAASGPVEVTAEFVAADGGRAGDVIRVMNPDNKRLIRARIVKKGLVEVTHDR